MNTIKDKLYALPPKIHMYLSAVSSTLFHDITSCIGIMQQEVTRTETQQLVTYLILYTILLLMQEDSI